MLNLRLDPEKKFSGKSLFINLNCYSVFGFRVFESVNVAGILIKVWIKTTSIAAFYLIYRPLVSFQLDPLSCHHVCRVQMY